MSNAVPIALASSRGHRILTRRGKWEIKKLLM